ncbi:hypothetical protein QBC47DRAFT_369981 [Echria macrotheca]|uniref:Uncharacterized protein n=1 Tax=Echria macrotheca TaxID=438768 RepID=A0AAJ0FFI0_9PEZI|nr:hypothetical protein QBC47DRAFT_369981 [Echria macrotheca]
MLPFSAEVDCLWEMQRVLEENRHAALVGDVQQQVPLRGARGELFPKAYERPRWVDWDGLLKQVHQRVAILSAIPKPLPTRTPALVQSGTGVSMRSRRTTGTGTGTGTLGAAGTIPGRIPGRGRSDREALDESHRALDRISYLGGILIPLPIVSGILSMSDPYGPEGDKFFVFWAVSIPLSVLAVLIIYADTIRKAEVWVEVAAEHVAAVPEGDEEDGSEKGWHRRKKAGDEEAQMATVATALPAEDGEEVLPVLVALPALEEEAEQVPEMILDKAEGRRARAWKRKKLGWMGAAKTILARQRPRYCTDELPEGVAAYERK